MATREQFEIGNNVFIDWDWQPRDKMQAYEIVHIHSGHAWVELAEQEIPRGGPVHQLVQLSRLDHVLPLEVRTRSSQEVLCDTHGVVTVPGSYPGDYDFEPCPGCPGCNPV